MGGALGRRPRQPLRSRGKVERSIALPAYQITNITFAGPDFKQMFVTSAATGLAASDYDGALFEVESGVRGLPTHEFAG